MPKTEVILTHNIIGLGAESDQVKVAAGYARNYFRSRREVAHSAHGLRTSAGIEALKQRRAQREADELNHMNDLSRSLAKLTAVVTVKTGEDGKMFGSVTSGTIADQLKTQFDVSLDKKKIHLEHPIRTLGEHEVELRLHADVVTKLKVRVESSTPLPPPAETPAPAEHRDDRPERRSRRPERAAAPATATAAPEPAEHHEKKPKAAKGEKTEKAGKAKKSE